MTVTYLPYTQDIEDERVRSNFEYIESNGAFKNGGIFTYAGSDAITNNSTWNFLAHADRVNGVVVPANSIVNITYRAHLDKTGGSNAVYAIMTCAPTGTMTANSYLVSPFGNANGGNNQYAEPTLFSGQAPTVTCVICTSGYMNGSTNGQGLVEYGYSGAGDPTDAFATGPQIMGAPISLTMPAGTYDFGIAYYTDATVTASRTNPWLCVDVRTF